MKLQQAQQIAEALKAELSPLCDRIEIGGSIRRKKPDPNDIELICIPKFVQISMPQVTFTNDHIQVTRNHLFDYLAVNYEGHIIKMGEKYAQIQLDLTECDEWTAEILGEDKYIKIDIFTATESTWGYIFMLRTGSAEFSKWVVTELKRRGFAPTGGEIFRDWLHRVEYVDDAIAVSFRHDPNTNDILCGQYRKYLVRVWLEIIKEE